MLTALQIRKLTRGFNLFDLDQNGVMDRHDCEMVIQATTKAMGYAPGSPEYTAYHDEYMAGWNALVALGDSDGDQKLTLAENLVAYDKLMALSRPPLRYGIATRMAKCQKRNTRTI